MEAPVLVEITDDIALVTLNRPESRNPLDPETQDALIATFMKLDAEAKARVAILTGAGSAFCAGGNVRRMGEAASGSTERTPAQARGYYRHGIQRLPRMFEQLEIPVIAAVNGPAMGAGCDLTCMCDLRIAGQSARFAESFVKLGIIPGDGGAWLLPRVVGFAKAAEMSLTGDALSADQALAYGLVSQVVPDAELLDAARALARRIAANPPQAVRMARRLLREAWNNRLDSVLEMSSAMQAVAQNTESAAVLGINVPRMIFYTFAINAVLAAAAALLVTPTYLAKFDMGESLGTKAFFAAIIGGFNNSRGALLGGLIVGVSENLAAAYISSAYKDAVALVIFMVVILFKPQGLLGRKEERKV